MTNRLRAWWGTKSFKDHSLNFGAGLILVAIVASGVGFPIENYKQGQTIHTLLQQHTSDLATTKQLEGEAVQAFFTLAYELNSVCTQEHLNCQVSPTKLKQFVKEIETTVPKPEESKS